MKLFWSSRSPFVRKVMIMAHQAELADRIERIPAVVTPFTVEPALLAFNPLDRIPTLVTDEGISIFESLAICEYFDSLLDNPVSFPRSVPRLLIHRGHSLGDGLMSLLTLWVMLRWRSGKDLAPEFTESAGLKLRTTLDLLNAEIHNLAETIHLGWATIGAALGYLDFRFPEEAWRSDRANLARWYDGFAQHPAAVATWPSD